MDEIRNNKIDNLGLPNVNPQDTSNDAQRETNRSQFEALDAERRQGRDENIADPSNDGEGGGEPESNVPRNPYLEMAKSIVKQLLGLIKAGLGGAVNPLAMISMYLNGRSLADKGETAIEAAISDDVVNDTPELKHEALFVQAQLHGVKGEVIEPSIVYWKDMQLQNVQAEKDDQRHSLPG